MARARISISLHPKAEELIKAVAAENGLDVSAFLIMAGRKEAARVARVKEAFADIDASIAEAETEADALPWPPEIDIDPEEAARIEAEVDAAIARSAAARRRGAAT